METTASTTTTTNTTTASTSSNTSTPTRTNTNINSHSHTTTTYLKFPNYQTPTKPKRRKCKETTITIPPTIVSPENTTTWCYPATKPPLPTHRHAPIHPPSPHPGSELVQSGSPFRIRFSPGSHSPVMDFSPNSMNSHSPQESLGFTKFNSALTAGLLNPMSPPPRSSPTLFEMMASEPDVHPRTATSQFNSAQNPITNGNPNLNPNSAKQHQLTAQDKKDLIFQRIWTILNSKTPGNLFNDSETSDIRLTLSSKDGISVTLDLHRQILVGHSSFFGFQLSDQWIKQQRGGCDGSGLGPYIVEIADCEDVEVYVETLRLMYCDDLRRMLMKEDVSKVLGILKVSAAIGFDAGVFSCLEYLEAAPWAEDEEENVASLLSKLRVDGVAASEVLKRVTVEAGTGTEVGNANEEVLLKLLHVVLEGKDERARRDMKGLVSKMLRENSSQSDIQKDSFYSACDGCLQLLQESFLHAAGSDLKDVGQIARQADNLYWILDILIDRHIAEDFLKKWASQTELSEAHSKVPAVHRYEVSRVTARLFVGIGKGQLLASKDARCLLLRTWLVPFYDDFGWMRRASRGLDRHLIEDGLSNTILTLPLAWQQDIMLAWFDRFLNSGEDCPNIQRGFEVWWRRAFWRRNNEHQPLRLLQITAAAMENS